jgi:hypothetical protein
MLNFGWNQNHNDVNKMGLQMSQCFFFFTIIITKFGRKHLGTMKFLLGIKDHPCRLSHKNMILHSSTQGTSYYFPLFWPLEHLQSHPLFGPPISVYDIHHKVFNYFPIPTHNHMYHVSKSDMGIEFIPNDL